MDVLNAVKILGLDFKANREEVKQAYRDLVKVWHPDRFPEGSRVQQKAQNELKLINEAYSVLEAHDFNINISKDCTGFGSEEDDRSTVKADNPFTDDSANAGNKNKIINAWHFVNDNKYILWLLLIALAYFFNHPSVNSNISSIQSIKPSVGVLPKDDHISILNPKSSLILDYSFKGINKHYVDGRIIDGIGKPKEDDVYFICSYPVFSGSGSANKINNTVGAYIYDSLLVRKRNGDIISLEGQALDFFKEYESFKKDYDSSMPYQININSRIILNQYGILTLAIDCFNYTGGVHGLSHTQYFVFDSNNGNQLSLDNIFNDSYENRLNDLVDTNYRRVKGLSKQDRLDSDKGCLFNNYIHFNKNFAITDKGVRFLYNEYEIAPYVYGQTIVDIPYAELSEILKK
jgi:hypothetical protein